MRLAVRAMHVPTGRSCNQHVRERRRHYWQSGTPHFCKYLIFAGGILSSLSSILAKVFSKAVGNLLFGYGYGFMNFYNYILFTNSYINLPTYPPANPKRATTYINLFHLSFSYLYLLRSTTYLLHYCISTYLHISYSF